MRYFSLPVLCGFIVGLALCLGCSSQNREPIMPQLGDDGNRHESWGAYDMTIDPVAGKIEVTPDREMMYHFNVTGYMSMCPGGCFTFRIVGIVGTVLQIEMTIKNPVKITAYDVRIIFTKLNGKTVVNPDSYTELFDPPSTPETINPFIAFRKEDPNRIFPQSPGSDKETVYIDFPPGASAATSWIIDASVPSNCGDPYEVNDMQYSGNLTPTGGSGVISCVVLDHQDNVSAVIVDTTPLNGGFSTMEFIPPHFWETQITNSEGAPPGDYLCLIKAKSYDPSNALTCNYVTVTVNQGQGDACDGAMNFFVASDGNWMVDGTIETFEGLQLITNLLDYTPSGPAANYHTVYYWSGKGGSFRNGWTAYIQSIAEGFGYTFRKQDGGDLNISDVRVMFWPALGNGDMSNPASQAEIDAMKNLLAEGGRIIITCEYDLTPSANDWVTLQLQRLGSSITMLYGGTPLNQNFPPEECEAFSHDINSVMFRAYGFLESGSSDAVVLYYGSLGEKIFIGEVL